MTPASHPAYAADENFVDRLVPVLIEIPVGTREKWHINKSSGEMEWEASPSGTGGRVIDYLPYPANYGFIPDTLLPRREGGDGDPLDVVLLGERMERGQSAKARPIGILKMIDGGDQDDKVLSVLESGIFSDVQNLHALKEKYPGVLQIIALWFSNYKGPNQISIHGWCDWEQVVSYYSLHAGPPNSSAIEPPVTTELVGLCGREVPVEEAFGG